MNLLLVYFLDGQSGERVRGKKRAFLVVDRTFHTFSCFWQNGWKILGEILKNLSYQKIRHFLDKTKK